MRGSEGEVSNHRADARVDLAADPGSYSVHIFLLNSTF
jgi:hypothetical protein